MKAGGEGVGATRREASTEPREMPSVQEVEALVQVGAWYTLVQISKAMHCVKPRVVSALRNVPLNGLLTIQYDIVHVNSTTGNLTNCCNVD